MFVHWDLQADLLLESQGHGVGLRVLLLPRTALQVGIVVALAPSQPVALLVEPETRHEDEVQAACGAEDTGKGEWFLKETSHSQIWLLLSVTAVPPLNSSTAHASLENPKRTGHGQGANKNDLLLSKPIACLSTSPRKDVQKCPIPAKPHLAREILQGQNLRTYFFLSLSVRVTTHLPDQGPGTVTTGGGGGARKGPDGRQREGAEHPLPSPSPRGERPGCHTRGLSSPLRDIPEVQG